MSDKKDFLDWLDTKTDELTKSHAARLVIQQAQRNSVRRMPPNLTLRAEGLTKQSRTVISPDDWRVLLTSGKSRYALVKETGCSERTIINQARNLNLPVPPSRATPNQRS